MNFLVNIFFSEIPHAMVMHRHNLPKRLFFFLFLFSLAQHAQGPMAAISLHTASLPLISFITFNKATCMPLMHIVPSFEYYYDMTADILLSEYSLFCFCCVP